MKRQFSFYEFVGVLVPSIILLYFAELILEQVYNRSFVSFESVGESVIFIIVAYGFGHIMNSVGNIFESIVWKIVGGMPTSWLNKPPRLWLTLFDDNEKERVQTKLQEKYGQLGERDYGLQVYNLLFVNEKTDRVDIFNGNYSLFRGLTVSILILAVMALWLLDWKYSVLPFLLTVLAFLRMFRFAKYYAKEVYRTFMNL